MKIDSPLLLLVCLVAFPPLASAVIIEPDDYAVGTDLSEVSEYVSLRDLSLSVSADSGWEQTQGPVWATEQNDPFSAPTGELTFGQYGLLSGAADDTVSLVQGFGLFFHQPVDSIEILAQNPVADYLPVSATWFAYDENGQQFASGSTSAPDPGETFQVDINVPDIWTLVIGAEDGSAVMGFDRLVFSPVPEAGSLALAGSGLMAGCIGFFIRRRQSGESVAPHAATLSPA
jgi:hypothetical protein